MTTDAKTYRELLGDEYAKGCHLIFVLRSSLLNLNKEWIGYGFVKGQMYHMHVNSIDNAVRKFAAAYGRPETIRVFDSQSEAHQAFPKFFNPDASHN